MRSEGSLASRTVLLQRLSILLIVLALIVLATGCGVQPEGASPDPDINRDGMVDLLDVSLVESCRGRQPVSNSQCEAADSDGDGDVDRDDFEFVAGRVAADEEATPARRMPGKPTEKSQTGERSPPVPRAALAAEPRSAVAGGVFAASPLDPPTPPASLLAVAPLGEGDFPAPGDPEQGVSFAPETPASGLLPDEPYSHVVKRKFVAPLASDVNGDGSVDILDVSLVESCRGKDPALVPVCASADTNRDGNINDADFNFVVAKLPGDILVLPAPEIFSGLPAYTNSATLFLTGVSVPYGIVEVSGGAGTVATQVGPFGDFEVSVSLLLNAANLLEIVTIDEAGNPSKAFSHTVVQDQTPPVLKEISPLDGTAVALTQVAVTGTVTDASGIGSVSVNGLPAALDGDGFQVVLPLGPGENLVNVVATDRASNQTTDQITLQRTFADQAGPVITLDQPVENALVSTKTIAVAGRLVDASPLAADAPLTLNDELVPVAGDRFSTTADLNEGANVLRLEALDAFGNPTVLERTVVLDTEPPLAPVVESVVPSSPTRKDRVTLQGLAEAGAGVEIAGGLAEASAVAGSDGSFLASVFLTPNARNRLLVVARDPAGNPGPATVQVVVHDSQPPVLSLRSPDPDANTELPEGSHAVVVSALDPSEPVSVLIDGVLAADRGSGLFQLPVTFVAGEQALTVEAEDVAGNQATLGASFSVAAAETEDDDPPQIVIVEPLPGAVASSPVRVAGSVLDQSEITELKVSGAVATPVFQDGFFEVQVDIAPEGNTEIQVTATDASENEATAQVVVTLDEGPPAAPDLEPIASPTAQLQVVVAGVAKNAAGAREPGATVQVEGGAAPASTTADDEGHFAVVVQLQPNTSNSLRVSATDEFDKKGPFADVVVVHDGVSPSLEASSPDDGATEVEADKVVAVTFSEPLDPASVHIWDATLSSVASVFAIDDAISWDGGSSSTGGDGVVTNFNTSTGRIRFYRVSGAVPTVGEQIDGQGSAQGIIDKFGFGGQGSLLLTGTGGPISSGEPTLSADGSVLSVVPTQPLLSDSVVRVELAKTLTDLAGNALSAPFEFSFATVDTLAPAVPVVLPLPPVRTREQALTVTGTTEPNARVQVSGGSSVARLRADASGNFAVWTVLKRNALNHLEVVAFDAANNRSEKFEHTTAQDLSAPEAVFVPPPGSEAVEETAALAVSFGEEVVFATLKGRLSLQRDGQVLPGQVRANAAGTGADFIPEQPLLAGATYTLQLEPGVQDLVGNTAGESSESEFRVAGGVVVAAPRVDEVSPPSPTKDSQLTLRGSADPGLTVQVTLEEQAPVEVAVGSDGQWQAQLTLLPDREQLIRVQARDADNNSSEIVALSVVQDETPPAVVAIAPAEGARPSLNANVVVDFSEPVDPALLDGNLVLLHGHQVVASSIGLGSGGTRAVLNPAAALAHNESYEVRVGTGVMDLAGNPLAPAFSQSFQAGDARRPEPPALAAFESPTAAASLVLVGSGFPGDLISASGGAAPVTAEACAAGQENCTPGSFELSVPLRPNARNILVVSAKNPANEATASTTVAVIQDSTPPALAVLSPLEGAELAGSPVTVTGSLEDASGIKSLLIGGLSILPAAGRFVASVPLVAGPNTIVVKTVDRAGNTVQIDRTVTLTLTDPEEEDDDPPVITLDSPAPGAVVGLEVEVSGTVNDASAIVSMRIGDADPALGGSALAVVLPDGTGVFSARLEIPTATNTIFVTAKDQFENVATVSVAVRLDEFAPPITLDQGFFECGGDQLPDPTDQATLLLAGTTEPGARVDVDGGALALSTTTDPAGDGRFEFSIPLRQETANLLRVSATDGVGNRGVPACIVVLHDSLGPKIVRVDPADRVEDVAADAVIQVTFSEPLDPASVDRNSLLLASSDGEILGAEPTLSPDGSVLSFVPNEPLPPGEEISVVVAGELSDRAGHSQGYDAFSSFRVAASATRVRGVVVDADGLALEGVTVGLRGNDLEMLTTAQGNFTLENATPGLQVVEIDGTTAAGSQLFSRVTLDVQVVAGEDNLLGRPIVLTPVDRASSQRVTGVGVGAGDEVLAFGGELEGFELAIPPQSVTFPDGKGTGFLTATAIDTNNIPGRLPDGSVPSMLVSLEPGGTEFDPPCRVRFPNEENLPAGSEVTIFSFDGAVSDYQELCSGVVCGKVAVLDEAGEPVLDAEGEPVFKPYPDVFQPVLDEAGEPVLDAEGEPVFEPYPEGCRLEDVGAVISTEPCIDHFSFIGYVPDVSVDLAQPGEARAFLSGRVVDSSNPPRGIPNIQVDVAASESRARTDADGRYTLPLPDRNLFALRVFAMLPSNPFSSDTSEQQFAVYQSGLVEPAISGTTEVEDIVVDLVLLFGDISFVNQGGDFVKRGVGGTQYDADGVLTELSEADATAVQVFVLQLAADGDFDPMPLASLSASLAAPGSFASSRYIGEFVGTTAAGTGASTPLRPGELVRIVAYSAATGYTGWSDLRVPSQAQTGTQDLEIDVTLHPPEAGITVARTFFDGAGERVTKPVANGGRVSNGDQYLEIATRFTVRGEVPPSVPGLALKGRFASTSNLGGRTLRFDVPPGDTTRVLQLRAAFPVELDPIEASRIERQGFVEVASQRSFASNRVLGMEVLGDGLVPERTKRFSFDVVSISASPPDEAGVSRVVGTLDTASPGSAVDLLNTTTSFPVSGQADADGAFEMLVPAISGDKIQVIFTDIAGRPDALFVSVPEGIAEVDQVTHILADPRQLFFTSVGDRSRLDAIGLRSSGVGNRLGFSEGVSFASANPAVATVNGQGVVRATGKGETFIELRLDELTSRARVTVAPLREPTIFIESAEGDYGSEIGRSSELARVGDTVVIEGEGFGPAPLGHTVTIGGVVAEVVGGNADELRVVVAEGTKSGSLQVTLGDAVSDGLFFRVTDGPIVTRLDPVAVLEGDPVRIYGVGFGETTSENAAVMEQSRIEIKEFDSAAPEFIETEAAVVDVTPNHLVILAPKLDNSTVVRVEVDGKRSNAKPLTILQPLPMRLALPPGFNIPNEELRVEAGVVSEAQPDAAGNLTVMLGKGVPTLLSVKDAEGKTILSSLGHTVLADAQNPPEISAFSAAQLAIVFPLGILGLPADMLPVLSKLVEGLQQTQDLAEVISDGLEADPYYMEGAANDPAFVLAQEAALEAAFVAFADYIADLPPWELAEVRRKLSLWAQLWEMVLPVANAAPVPPIPDGIPEQVEPNKIQSGLSVTSLSTTEVAVANRNFRWVSAKIENPSNPGGGPVLPHLSLGTFLAGAKNWLEPATHVPTTACLFCAEMGEQLGAMGNFFMNGFTKETKLKADVPFDINGGPYRLELIGPSSKASLRVSGLSFEFESSELADAEQVEAYVIVTCATAITEFIEPLLELASGLKVGGDAGEKKITKSKELIKTLKDTATSVQSGKIRKLIDAFVQFIENPRDGGNLVSALVDILTDLLKKRQEQAGTSRAPPVRVDDIEISGEAIKKLMQGIVPAGLRDKVVDKITDLHPLTATLKFIKKFADMGITAGNVAKAASDFVTSKPLEEFTFSITTAQALGVVPPTATLEEVESGTFEVVIRGKHFGTDPYITNQDLQISPGAAIRACVTTENPLLFETFNSIAGSAVGCNNPADLYDRGRAQYIAFTARPGPGVPFNGILLADVLSVTKATDPNTGEVDPNGIMQLRVRVPAGAFSGPIVYRSKRLKRQDLLFNVDSEEEGLKAYVTNRTSNTISTPLFSVDGSQYLGTAGSIPHNGNRPWAIDIHPDTLTAWITDRSDGTVHVLDIRNQKFIGPGIPVGPLPVDIAVTPSGRFAVVATAAGQIPIIDTLRREVVKVIPAPVESSMSARSVAIRPDNTRAYVLFSEGGFGGEQRGRLVAIDIDHEHDDSDTFLTVVDATEVVGMDEPAAVAVRDLDRAYVVAKGLKGPGSRTYPTHFDISEYDISNPDRLDLSKQFFDVPQSESAGTYGNGVRYPPPPVNNLDLSVLGPIDIAFNPTGNGDFAYMPAFHSGNVAVFDLRRDAVVAATRSDLFTVENIVVDLVPNTEFFSVVHLAIPYRLEQTVRKELVDQLTLPRHIDFSQNGEFALVTLYKGGLFMVRDKAVGQVIRHSYENPADANDLSDVPIECLAARFNDNFLPFEPLGDCNGVYAAGPGPRGNSNTVANPAYSVGGAGDGPEDVAIEPVVGIVKPLWGTCVADAPACRQDDCKSEDRGFAMHVASAELTSLVSFRLLNQSFDSYLRGPGIGLRGHQLFGDADEGWHTLVDVSNLTLPEDEALPDGEYVLEARGSTPHADAAKHSIKIYVDNAPPELQSTQPADEECVEDIFDLTVNYDPGGDPEIPCNALVRCELLIEGEPVAEDITPEDGECVFRDLDPADFSPQIDITLLATDSAGNLARDTLVLFHPEASLAAPATADLGEIVAISATGVPGDGRFTFSAQGPNQSFFVVDQGTTVDATTRGGARLEGPQTRGTVTVSAGFVINACASVDVDPVQILFKGCGDGETDPDEECDEASQNSDTTPNVCRATCELPSCGDGIVDTDYDEQCDDGNALAGDGCDTACRFSFGCGDGVLASGEQCDDGNQVDGDGCSASCEVEPECGDGVSGAGEECDDGLLNSDTTPDACRTTCDRPRCGDRVIDSLEACDNGRLNSNTASDACRTDCRLPECGDGIVDFRSGERCDQGSRNSDTTPNACRTTCLRPVCGDQIIDIGYGEQCDEGAQNSDAVPDACRTSCQPAACGDSVQDSGEACDDGNRQSGDGCRFDCTTEICGDGIVDFGEECDDGNQVAGDGCRSDCTAEVCGDGRQDSGEACDDGAANSNSAPDSCRTTCALPGCGDGVQDGNEQCDDGPGNANEPNACRLSCVAPTCGDGIFDFLAGEQCDDGGVVDGDGCSAACQVEPSGGGGGGGGGGAPGPTVGDLCINEVVTAPQSDWSDDGPATGGPANVRFDALPRGATASANDEYIEIRNAGSNPVSLAGVVLRMTDATPAVYTLGTDALCGNGSTDAGEVCDDGNRDDDAACGAFCDRVPACGDGRLDPFLGEGCDDGNTTPGDGCSDLCAVETGYAASCGNGVTDLGEACDDGNFVSGDGCSAQCHDERTLERYSVGASAQNFPPGAVLVVGDPTGEMADEVFLELMVGAVAVADLEIGGNRVGSNFESDDDRDGSVDEDPVGGNPPDDDGDGNIDEDPPGTDPVADGAPEAGGTGRSSGPGDESLHRVAALDDDARAWTRGAGTPGLANTLGARLRIEELVTDPESDWSDTQAGNGVAFDTNPGIAPPDAGDEYIEIRNTTAVAVSLRGLVLRMTDASPVRYRLGTQAGGAVEIYPAGSDVDALQPDARVVIGNPPGEMSDDVFVELLDPCSGVVSDVEVGGNVEAVNFEADADRDGRVDEDAANGVDDDGDGLTDEDGPGGDPLNDGAPAAGQNGAANDPSDEALVRVANTGVDALDFARAAGSPGS